MDSTFTAPRTMEEVFFYCERSANPVGELVLRIFGLWNAERRVCSDAICTALQLANFWQDIAPDKAKGRFFVPATWLERHRLDAERLLKAERLHDKPSVWKDVCRSFASLQYIFLPRAHNCCRCCPRSGFEQKSRSR